MSMIVDFYLERTRDNRGRTLGDILLWDDERLEREHDYIQWLFPGRKPSGFNSAAPILDTETIQAFHEHVELREKLLRSLDRMLAFYGFYRVSNADLSRVQKDATWEQRRRVWLSPSNHNFLRVTRILACLRNLGCRDASAAFFGVLQEMYWSEGDRIISSESFARWKSAHC